MHSVGQCSSRCRSVVCGIVLAFAFVGLLACQTVPITGREQLILASLDEENRLGIEAYEKILQQEKTSNDPRLNALVRRVGERIAAVVNRGVTNAFALPGGKMAVYTGILEYTPTGTGLAVVIGHEVAHALPRHGGERLSRSMMVPLGLVAVQSGLNSE